MTGDSQKVVIVGGGIIGLSTAWYLTKSGFEVTVLDRDSSRKESCSEENAGMVVPSHFIPLAAPGIIGQGLRWMFNPRSPFYLRPRLYLGLWRWCWQFVLVVFVFVLCVIGINMVSLRCLYFCVLLRCS